MMKGFIPIVVAIIGLIILAYVLGLFPAGQVIIGSYSKTCWDINNKGGHTNIDPCLRYCDVTWTEGFNERSQCDAYRQEILGNPNTYYASDCRPWTDPLRGGQGYVTDVKQLTTEPYPNPSCPSPTTTMPSTTTTTQSQQTTTTYSYPTTTTTMPTGTDCGWDIMCHISRLISSLGRLFKL